MSSPDFIPALSLDQPFAHLISDLGMNVESRTWTTERRGTIAIHATAKKSPAEFRWVADELGVEIERDEVAYSAVVAIADLVDVITEDEVTRATAKWFIGPYGFVLENIVRLPKPVAVKGNRKFWHLKGAPLKAVLSQLSRKQRESIRAFDLKPKKKGRTSRSARSTSKNDA